MVYQSPAQSYFYQNVYKHCIVNWFYQIDTAGASSLIPLIFLAAKNRGNIPTYSDCFVAIIIAIKIIAGLHLPPWKLRLFRERRLSWITEESQAVEQILGWLCHLSDVTDAKDEKWICWLLHQDLLVISIISSQHTLICWWIMMICLFFGGSYPIVVPSLHPLKTNRAPWSLFGSSLLLARSSCITSQTIGSKNGIIMHTTSVWQSNMAFICIGKTSINGEFFLAIFACQRVQWGAFISQQT